jgi:modulator of FtsH protease
MGDWVDFYVAEVGAAAALAGLLVVAISINIAKIMSFPALPGRAAQTLIMIGGSLVVASLALLPGQPMPVFGAEIVVVALIDIVVGFRQTASVRKLAGSGGQLLWIVLPFAVAVLVGLPMLVGGAMLIVGQDYALYWVAVGIILSFVVTLENGWVLLVEILR